MEIRVLDTQSSDHVGPLENDFLGAAVTLVALEKPPVDGKHSDQLVVDNDKDEHRDEPKDDQNKPEDENNMMMKSVRLCQTEDAQRCHKK